MAFRLPGQTSVQPHKAGELFANWLPTGTVVAQFEHEQVTPDWTKVRAGRPAPAGGRTVSQMEDLGWVGLYLREDQRLPAGAEVVDTPAFMNEPAPEPFTFIA